MPERHAIILGSGCVDLMKDRPSMELSDGPYGTPSSPLYEIELDGHSIVALARHGIPHSIAPHQVNYRANIAALAEAGVSKVVALATVGVITESAGPGEIALPDQLIDYTWGRAHTFVEDVAGAAGHIEFTDPFANELRSELKQAADSAEIACFDGGVYAATQGPRLETAAEVNRLERDGADFIGMTAMPEAALAAEMGLAYACIALVVNKAAGRGDQPIHAEVESASLAARTSALAIVGRYLSDQAGETG